MSYEEYEYEQPSALDWARVGIGLTARGVFWLCFLFIVGNAAIQAVNDDQWFLALIELGFAPFTFFIYPFAAPPDAMAWPLAEGTSFIPFLVAGFIAYPISTFIGGMEPATWGGR